MPIVNLVPKSYLVQMELEKRMKEVRPRLKSQVANIFGLPETDVIVNLVACPYADFDPEGADLIVYLETCPSEAEQHAHMICRKLSETFYLLNIPEVNLVEIWSRFIPGPWSLAARGVIIDCDPKTLSPIK